MRLLGPLWYSGRLELAPGYRNFSAELIELAMDLNDLERIIEILKANDVTEFELNQDGTQIKLSRLSGKVIVSDAMRQPAPIHLEPAIVGALNGETPHKHEPPKAELDPKLKKVESPIVGTFYKKPSPDADPFVKEGDLVKKGDTLCIIEAMKLMNEIEAPCGGKIVKSLLQDGQVVEYGEVLFLMEPA